MRRLTGLDATFLQGETPSLHQHTLKISILDPTGAPEGYSHESTKQVMAERLHRLPPFLWKLAPTPFGLHHPVWIEDPDFDLDFHVRRIACPAPGGPHELCEVISEIASRPLDRSRPLWELWMVDGLEGGRVGSVSKVHHALADGVASAEMLDHFYDTEPLVEAAAPTVFDPPPAPTRFQLLVAAVRDLFTLLVHGVPNILRRSKESKALRAEHAAADSGSPPKAYKAPPTSMNRVLTPHRSFTFVTTDFADVKKVKTAFDCTVNDVVLAVVAGSLRNYLDGRGELPDAPLVASVPISTRTEEQRGTYGNRLGKMYLSLPTDVADPVERLAAAHRSAAASKAEFADTWGARLENWLELWPPAMIRAVGGLITLVKKRGGPSSENLIISNVPGPRSPLYVGDTRVESFLSVGPLSQGVGLNVTVWSYVDQLNFALIACREAVPDLWAVTDGLRDELDHLVKVAEQR